MPVNEKVQNGINNRGADVAARRERLGWRPGTLARAARIEARTLTSLEAGSRQTRPGLYDKVIRALEAAEAAQKWNGRERRSGRDRRSRRDRRKRKVKPKPA